MDLLLVTHFEKLEFLVFSVHLIHAWILSTLFYHLLERKLIFNLVCKFHKHRIVLVGNKYIVSLLLFHLSSDALRYFWLCPALKNLTY